MTRFQIVSFSILHALATLSIPALIFLLGGCLEPELQNKPGPAIPCEEIQKAMNDSMKGPWTFEVGQFVHIENTAAPVNQAPNLVSDLTELVLETAPYQGITALRLERTVVKDGKKDTEETIEGAPGLVSLCAAGSTDTFHNLSVTTTKINVPHPPGDACDARYVNCQVDVTQFMFDKLVYLESGEKLPLHILVTTSNHVPYLARMLQFCVTSPLETNGPRIPVTQCSTVRNFEFSAN